MIIQKQMIKNKKINKILSVLEPIEQKTLIKIKDALSSIETDFSNHKKDYYQSISEIANVFNNNHKDILQSSAEGKNASKMIDSLKRVVITLDGNNTSNSSKIDQLSKTHSLHIKTIEKGVEKLKVYTETEVKKIKKDIEDLYWLRKGETVNGSNNVQAVLNIKGTGTQIANNVTTLNFTGGTPTLNSDCSVTVPLGGGSASPLTTKGDVYTFDTANQRLGVGTNGQALLADSTQPTGLKWTTLGGGTGDMILAASQTNSGVKTFLDATFGLRNVANTITSFFTNTATLARTWTLPDKNGTVAMTSDITGINSGTNTGDQTITLTGGVTGSGTGSFAATVITNANLTGDITSVGNATTLTNAPVIAKVLTGYVSGAGVVAATDSILAAIQKLNGNVGVLVTGVSSVFGRTGAVVATAGDYTSAQITEVTNLFFTNARAIAATLTGYVSGAGTVAATDTILQAIQKINGNDALKAPIASPTFTGTVTLPAGQVVNGVTLSAAAGAGNFLRGDGTYAAPAGGGDMVLASAQTNSGLKTFLDTTLGLRNVANTFTSLFTNAATAARTWTLKDASGTLAFTSDITGTNSGTNTGDQTITLTGGVTGSGTGSFATTVVTNANLTGGVTSVGNATTVVTNANLTGVITSVGNATSIFSQTGTGTKFVVDTSPTLVTPVLGVATGTSLTLGGVVVPTISSTSTETNKRIQPRVVTTTQSATPAINTDNGDVFTITALAQAITSMTSSLTGTPVTDEKIIINITDNGTARAITWGATFASGAASLPTTTVVSTLLKVGFIWNAVISKWECEATSIASGGTGTVTSVTSADANITVATTTTTPVITLVQAPALKSATTTVSVSAATAPTTGQVLTATSGTAATWQTPSAGGGITWTEVTGTTQTATVNNGYITNNAGLVTLTLPATATVGSIVRIAGSGAGGWSVAQASGQTIIWDSGAVASLNQTTTGVGGSIASTDRYDSMEMLCITTNTTFVVISSKGSPNLT
jgi:hypothetical protein